MPVRTRHAEIPTCQLCGITDARCIMTRTAEDDIITCPPCHWDVRRRRHVTPTPWPIRRHTDAMPAS